MRGTLISIVFVMGIAIYILTTQVVKQHKEINRQESNFVALNSEVVHYKTQYGQNAAQIKTLILNNSELRTYNTKLIDKVKDLNIRIKDVERISQTTLESNYNLITRLRDSIKIVRDTITNEIIDTISIQYSRFSDKWITFYQEQTGDNLKTEIQTRDSITIVQHWEPYRFLWFKFGKKESKETITNANPYSKITYAISIKTLR